MTGQEFKYFANVFLDLSTEESKPDDAAKPEDEAKSGTESDAAASPSSSLLADKSKQIILTVSITGEEFEEIRKQEDPNRAGMKILHGRGRETILSSSSWTCCACKKGKAENVLNLEPESFKRDVPGGAMVLCDKAGSYPVCSNSDCEGKIRAEANHKCPYFPSYQIAETDEDCKIIQHIRDKKWAAKASKCISCGKSHKIPTSYDVAKCGTMWQFYCSQNCQERNLEKVDNNGYGRSEAWEYYEAQLPGQQRWMSSGGGGGGGYTRRVNRRRRAGGVIDNRWDKENWHGYYHGQNHHHRRHRHHLGIYHDEETMSSGGWSHSY